jgi:hypothetical protein
MNAVAHIERDGILLAYPVTNHPQPLSLWKRFYPRTEMRWEWDDDGDSRVAEIWRLKEELSRSGKVVYAKWFRQRATFFSREVFTAMLALLAPDDLRGLPSESIQILELLNVDSPLSTKEIKAAVELQGRSLQSTYERAMKALWSRLLIVGFGEKDDGAFPSLAIGATQLLFEELWQASRIMEKSLAWSVLNGRLPNDSLFLEFLQKQLKVI